MGVESVGRSTFKIKVNEVAGSVGLASIELGLSSKRLLVQLDDTCSTLLHGLLCMLSSTAQLHVTEIRSCHLTTAYQHRAVSMIR